MEIEITTLNLDAAYKPQILSLDDIDVSFVKREILSTAQYDAQILRTAGKIKEPALPMPPALKVRKVGRYIYLPVEVASRELASRARIAGEMARSGYHVVLGASWALMKFKWGDLPPGIVLFKTLNALDARVIYQAACAGHITACLNEELLVMPEDEPLYRMNMNEHAVTLIDHVFAHSKTSADVLKRVAPGKVSLTGSPRQIEKIKPKPDGDILVCGMAGTINNAVPFSDYIRMIFHAMGKSGDDVPLLELTRAQVAHERKHYDTVLECVDALRRVYGARVKFRPHPIEHMELYEDIQIQRGVAFSEALRRASCVVYVSGCGTGVESVAAGIPAVRLGSGGFGKSRAFEPSADTVAGVVDLVAGALDNSDRFNADGAVDIAPLTLSETLQSIYEKNKYPMPFSIEKAYAKRERVQPEAHWLTKFPVMADGEIASLTGCKVTKLDWNQWLVHGEAA